MTLTGPLKWHGGKQYLASRIVALQPPCIHYVEPFAGGLAVLLARDPDGVSEVANDLNAELTAFWNVLACEEAFKRFHRLCEATPFSEWEWNNACNHPGYGCGSGDAVSGAHAFFVRCRQSLAGRMKSFAPLSRTRVRRGMNEQASAWLNAVEGLPAVHARLKRVVILNRDALDVIRSQDGKDTLFYIDAPYVKDSRTAPEVYDHEMTDEQHRQLIEVLLTIKGKAQVSMYHHPIYDVLSEKHGWHLAEFDLPNNASGAKEKRRATECLWMNYSPPK